MLHKPVRRHFVRRRIVVGGLAHQFQADLIDGRNLKKVNDRLLVLLTSIDVLGKYAWVVPLKNKTGTLLAEAFKRIFAQGRKPLKLQTDKATKFRNKVFQHFLKEEDVDFFVTHNEDIKASIVERFNRTLNESLWRYFTRNNTLRYVEALSKLVRAYNHSYHLSMKRAPADVSATNQEEVWQTLYGKPHGTLNNGHRRPKLKEGDRVRISKARRMFKKGYLPSWSEELFTISRVKKTTLLTYMPKDNHEEELEGIFTKKKSKR